MIVVTLIKVSKLGGELEEERQLNKSLRENQEEWQVPPKMFHSHFHCHFVLCSLRRWQLFQMRTMFPLLITMPPQTRLKRAEVEVAVLQQTKDREILELQEQVMRLSCINTCLNLHIFHKERKFYYFCSSETH